MKKKLSGLLAASLITSLIGALPPVSETAAATSSEDTAVSVTDLSKYETNDIIITYKKEANATKKKTLSICGLSAAQQADTEVTQLTDNSVVLKLDSNADLKTSIETLSQDSRVAYIQPNYIYHLCDTDIDIDSVYNNLAQNTDFSKQWGLYNDGTTSYTESVSSIWGRPQQVTIQATSRMDISLPEAWSICAAPKRETVVAIVDTGVMYDHDDLKEHIWTNEDEIEGDGIDNDNNGHIDDVHGWNFFDERVYDNTTTATSPVEGNNTYYNKNSNIEDSHGTHGAGKPLLLPTIIPVLQVLPLTRM